jgi:large subunit ribosomal protein L3
MFHRRPGSIGSSADPARVVKGTKLPGQYGNKKVTVRNVEIVDIKPEENLVLVKGSVPGANLGVVLLKKSKEQA